MRINRCLVRWAVTLTVCFLAACAPLLAQPPEIDIPESALKAPLTEPYREKIRKWVNYYLDIIRKAENNKQLSNGRVGLVQGYYKYADSTYYQFAYAQIAADKGLTVLKQFSDHARQINLAMALSRMSQVSIQPALEEMVTNQNPALRYCGWQGYYVIRRNVLAQGGEYVTRMLSSLEKAAGAEEVPAAFGEMLRVMDPGSSGASASGGIPADAQVKFVEILVKHWRKRCLQVRAGSAEMPAACGVGVSLLPKLAGAAIAGDKKNKTKLLQMAINMAMAAAQAYQVAEQRIVLANKAEKKDPEAERILRASGMLLVECEAALNALAGTKKRDITDALTDTKVPVPRWAQVQRKLLDWADELKKEGVTAPPFPPPKPPTTAPATAPSPATAPAPSTAPAPVE